MAACGSWCAVPRRLWHGARGCFSMLGASCHAPARAPIHHPKNKILRQPGGLSGGRILSFFVSPLALAWLAMYSSSYSHSSSSLLSLLISHSCPLLLLLLLQLLSSSLPQSDPLLLLLLPMLVSPRFALVPAPRRLEEAFRRDTGIREGSLPVTKWVKWRQAVWDFKFPSLLLSSAIAASQLSRNACAPSLSWTVSPAPWLTLNIDLSTRLPYICTLCSVIPRLSSQHSKSARNSLLRTLATGLREGSLPVT